MIFTTHFIKVGGQVKERDFNSNRPHREGLQHGFWHCETSEGPPGKRDLKHRQKIQSRYEILGTRESIPD